MKSRRMLTLIAAGACLVLVACDPVRVSVSTTGTQANDVSFNPSVSGDGSVVTFESPATNLVAGDTNGAPDVFVRDVSKGTTVRASVSSTGAQGNSSSMYADLSSNGRFVAFESYATNLVPGGPSLGVYVHDRQTGSTVLASRDATGTAIPVGMPAQVAVSATGAFVAFMGNNAVFRYDSATRTATRVLGFDAIPASISDDGRFLATNTLTVTGVHTLHVNAWDLSTGQAVFTGPADSDNIHMTRDARFAVYAYRPNCFPSFMPVCTSGASGVNVRDLVNGIQQPVVRTVGEPYISVAGADLSTNGRWVAIGIDGNVYRFDTDTGTFTLVTVAPDGSAANGPSSSARISADGATVAFGSSASNLVASDTNRVADVFTRRP